MEAFYCYRCTTLLRLLYPNTRSSCVVAVTLQIRFSLFHTDSSLSLSQSACLSVFFFVSLSFYLSLLLNLFLLVLSHALSISQRCLDCFATLVTRSRNFKLEFDREEKIIATYASIGSGKKE